MNTPRASSLLPLSLLVAAASLPAQTVTILSGGLGAETVTHGQAFDTTGNLVLGVGLEVEYLVVGGGGGGGGGGSSTSAWGTGGGGAGGLLAGTRILTLSPTSAANTFAVSVGAGGAGGQKSDTVANQQGSNGADSSFLDVIALGGGGGGGNKLVGGVGGSGGGGGGRGTGTNLRTAGGAGTEGQGFAGGASRDDNSNGRSAGGGGGGAGGLGGQGGTDTTTAGDGGLGLASSITGTSVLYAGGGGGGAIDTNIGAGETAGIGGSGIGGAGSISGNGGSGLANTGSGGGGVGTNGVGGSGGSGVVVLRYLTAAVAGSAGSGGTVAPGTGSAEGYTVHQFTATGSSSLDLSSLDLANQRMVTKTSGAFSGAGYLVFNSASLTTPSTFILTGNSSAHSGLNILNAGATVQVGDGGASGALGSGDIYLNQGASLVFNRADDITVGNKLTGNSDSGNLRDQGTLVKRGAGKLTLTNTASYYGMMQVEEGELVHNRGVFISTPYIRTQVAEGATYTLVQENEVTSPGGYGAFGLATSGAGRLVLEGTARISLYSYSGFTSGLAHTGGTVIKGMGVRLRSEGQIAPGSSLTIQGNGSLSSDGRLDLGDVRIESGGLSGIYLTATSLEVDAGSLSAGIEGATPLLKTGAGEFLLNSFLASRTGANRVEAGTLKISNAASLGQGATTVAGGDLQFNLGSTATARMTTLVLDGGAVSHQGAIGTRLLDADTLDLRSGTISLSLVGKGNLTKTTPGTVTLTENNSAFAGFVTVSEGTLRLLSTQGLGSSSAVFLDGGTLELAGNTRVGYFEQTGGAITGGTLVSSLVLTESGLFGSALADDVGGPSGIFKRTSGTTQVTAANTFTGGIRVEGGTLQLAGAGSFDAAAYLIAMTGGTLDLGGKAQTLSGIDGNGAIALGDGGALTVAFESRASVFAGVISGDGTLTKSGAGHLFLLGDNTYTGATLVTGGKLAVNGTLASSSLAIQSAATLGGSGTIAGATVISGIHAPGNSPGLQTFGSSLSYEAGAEIQWELAGQTDSPDDRGWVFDGIDVAGDLTFAGATFVTLAFDLYGSDVTWADPFWTANHSWKLLDVGGTVLGFENLALGDTASLLDSQGSAFGTSLVGAQFALALRSGDLYIDFTAAAIPEPSTYGLILGGLALAGAACRRRRMRRR